MENFDNKQKIILAVLAVLVVTVILVYVFTKDTSTTYLVNNVQEELIVTNDKQENESENKIFIHIAGMVANPGVFEVGENSRIVDVIELAGGVIEGADIQDVNLAYKVEDGQKIYIPSVEEVAKEKESENKIEYVTNSSGVNIEEGSSINENTSIGSVVNINIATQTELETLSGIGPSTAQKIIEYRQENGKFKNIEDIKNVPGIGDAKFDSIKNNIKI